MDTKTINDVLIAVVPVVISGLVAIVTSKQVSDLKDALAKAEQRIARLEQALTDNHLPLPPNDLLPKA